MAGPDFWRRYNILSMLPLRWRGGSACQLTFKVSENILYKICHLVCMCHLEFFSAKNHLTECVLLEAISPQRVVQSHRGRSTVPSFCAVRVLMTTCFCVTGLLLLLYRATTRILERGPSLSELKLFAQSSLDISIS